MYDAICVSFPSTDGPLDRPSSSLQNKELDCPEKPKHLTHPVALLAHGYAASKETLFLYGEALAAAGFICYSVDQPGHGASSREFTFMEAVQTLEAVAREVGAVDVFAGSSMGGFTGGEAVREGGMRPGLFVAIGSTPVLGDHAPPLIFLAGQFEEAFPPDLLKTRTDARLVGARSSG